VLGVLLGLAMLLAGGAGGVRLAWQRGLGGLDVPAQLWEKSVRVASWAGMGPTPQETPREFARSVRQQAPEVEGIDVLAEGYTRSRFGGKAPSEEERETLESAWKSVRGGLLRRLIRRRIPSRRTI
jgi:hypothetical protein